MLFASCRFFRWLERLENWLGSTPLRLLWAKLRLVMTRRPPSWVKSVLPGRKRGGENADTVPSQGNRAPKGIGSKEVQ